MKSSLMRMVCVFVLAVVLISTASCSSGGGSSSSGSTTYSISGGVTADNTALGGVTMTLSGTSTASATTDASGNYSFAALANGSYTVTPTMTGYTFSPVSKAITVNGANSANDNFTAAANATATYTMSGTVMVNGSGLAGVTMTLTSNGATVGTVTTDANGAFIFTGLTNGDYVITPSKSGYTISPASVAKTISNGNVSGVTFTAQTISNSAVLLSGTAACGSPLASATVTVKGANGLIKTITTGLDGKYSIDVTGLTAPYLLQVPSDGSDLYSVATTTGIANIHPFTDLIIRNWYAVQGGDLDADFANSGAIALPPSANDIAVIEAVVRNILKPWLSQSGQDPTTFNLLTTPFDANSTGFDNVLDHTEVAVDTTGQVTVTTTDPTTGIGGDMVSTDITNLTNTDSTPPSAPSGLTALAADSSKIVLVWNASTDNIGVAGYNIYRNNTKIGTSPYPVYNDAGLTSSTTYTYQVEAVDAAGNVSVSKSAQASATTLAAADATPPSVPEGVSATALSSGTMNITWNASTDNVSVLGYNVFRDGTKIGTVTTTSYSDTGLSAGTDYCYTVTAVDTAGNASTASTQSCATTLSAGAPVTTVWKSSWPGTVFNDESGTGVIQHATLKVTQQGNNLSGPMIFSDSLGVSTLSTFTGVISGSTVTVLTPDYDPACSGRTVAWLGVVGTSSLVFNISAPAGGTCSAFSNVQLTFSAYTPRVYTADGTYTYDASSETLTYYITSSNWPSDGPQVGGPGVDAGAIATATTFTSLGNLGNIPWTRAAGTPGDITGAWLFNYDIGGRTYQLTFNQDNTMSLVANVILGYGVAHTRTENGSNGGGYYGFVRYDDPQHLADTVTATAPGGGGSAGLIYSLYNPGEWSTVGQSFGGTHPTLPYSPTISATNAGGTTTVSAPIQCFVEAFATNLTAFSHLDATPVFTWTQAYTTFQPNYQYSVHVSDSNNNPIWDSPSTLDGSSMLYTGPTLSVGGTYNYYVRVGPDCGILDCESYANGSFVY